MKSNIYTSTSKRTLSLLKIVFVNLLVIFISTQASAQSTLADKTIKGIIKFSEDNQPAPGVNIYLKGSTAEGTYSDAKGQFEFPRQLKTGDVLLFSFIGRQTTEYIVPEQPVASIEIVMTPDYIEMVEDALVEGDESACPSALARLLRKVKGDR